MAYGYSRGRRDYEPDPRDLIEDAARAVGMSVQEWLERSAARSAYAEDDDAPRGSRRRYRPAREEREESPLDGLSRRYSRRAPREEAFSEDRVARILDDAMGAMQETIRANEAKTASVIAALGEQLEEQARASASGRQVNSVQQMVSDIGRGFGAEPATPEPDAGRSAIDLLEQRITNVVSLLEKRASNPPQDARRAGIAPEHSAPRARLERDVAALGDRLDQLSQNLTMHLSVQAQQAPRQDVSQHLSKLHQEIARLGKIAQSTTGSPDVMTALEEINARIGQMERSTGAQPIDRVAQEIAALRTGLNAARETSSPDLTAIDQRFDTLRGQLEQVVDRIGQIQRTPLAAPSLDRFAEEIASLRAGLHVARMQSEPDLSGIERRFETLNGRIDLLADKISSLKPGAPRDLRSQRSFETAVGELKSLIERNKAPADDGRLLVAVQSLEQRLDAVVRATAQKETSSGVAALEQQMGGLKSRLDDIADKMAERRFVDDIGSGSVTQIGQAIEDLKRTIQGGTRGTDDVRVLEAFEAIERRMESLERTPSELVARVDQLHSMLAARPSVSAQVTRRSIGWKADLAMIGLLTGCIRIFARSAKG
jgi:hypothetical protein